MGFLGSYPSCHLRTFRPSSSESHVRSVTFVSYEDRGFVAAPSHSWHGSKDVMVAANGRKRGSDGGDGWKVGLSGVGEWFSFLGL